MEVGQDEAKCADLLSKLKGTVESMLGCHPADTWDMHGSSHRLHMAMADILKHGFRFFRDNVKYLFITVEFYLKSLVK